jgi:hypothetical protein
VPITEKGGKDIKFRVKSSEIVQLVIVIFFFPREMARLGPGNLSPLRATIGVWRAQCHLMKRRITFQYVPREILALSWRVKCKTVRETKDT